MDTSPPPKELEIPSLEGIDFLAGFQDAMNLAVDVNFVSPWTTHVRGLELSGPECPDWYLGNPDAESILELAEDQPGVSWYDFCRQGTATFGGWANVNNDVSSNAFSDGSYEDNASRTLIANGTISTDAGKGEDGTIWWNFDGAGTDSLYANRTGGKTNRWIYSSLVEAMVTGTGMFPEGESLTPGGYRTDMYLFITGGNEDQIEARGNVLYQDHLIGGRFDSFEMDVAFQGNVGAGPDDCLLEPLGWMGLRDQEAYWYDLVFLPRYDNDITDTGYRNDPYSECDGCGTLYVRGVNFLEEVGEICPDFSAIWGRFQPPDVEDFIWMQRE